MAENTEDVIADPESPVKPTTPEKQDAPPAKKQLSSAQKASLARAREKARQSKLAKSQAKAEQEKEFAKFQAKPSSPVKQDDEDMADSQSENSPSPVKKKKTKRHANKKRRHYTSSESETSEEDPSDEKQRIADHATLAKQVYQNNLARYKGEIVYLAGS